MMSNFNFDLDATTDEDFFGTLKSKTSKLQQLFGDDDLPKDEKHQSLKYERPKASDLKKPAHNETTSSSHKSSTLMAKVVTAYRQGELQGKVGLALIKNADESLNVLMYKSKAYILVTLKLLNNDREVLFKQHKYWQFYDDLQVYWSFSFDTQQDEDDFRDILIKSGHRFKESEDQQDAKEEEQQQEDIPHVEMNENNIRDVDLPQLPPKDVTKESKNALIKRMAKMGQPLPKLSTSSIQTTTDFSDSSDTEVINMPLPQKPTIAPRANRLATVKNNQQLVTSTMALNSAIYPTTAMESQYMQMLLTEQRTQGSELRMNMNKLETKIEKVLDKIDLIDRVGSGDPKEKRHKDDEILELEEKILNLKKENRKLKLLNEQRNEQESYEHKSKDILNEYKDDLIDINMGHVRDLRTLLKSCIENIQKTQQDLKDLQEKHQEVVKKGNQRQKELEAVNTGNKELDQQLTELKEQQLQMKKNVEENEKTIGDYEQQIKDLKKELQDKSDESSQNSLDLMVKSIMNNLYADICDKLEISRLDSTDQVLAIVATSIKQQTLKSLQQQQSG